MNRIQFQQKFKFSVIVLLTLVISLMSASCIASDEQDIIDSLLKKAEGGELTFVTRDGESVTITLSKTTQQTALDKPSETACEPTKSTELTKKPAATPDLSDYLPVLNSIEDVFKTLGVWEDANAMHKEGYTWAHIAGELGYNSDTMYARLQEIIESQLHEAKELGLLNQEKFEYKIGYYGELALKWVGKIFGDTNSSASLSDYLPVLNSIEDVFKTLGVWEDANAMHKEGYTWAHIAGELGYNSDTMYARLQEIIESQLHEAKELGLIDQEKLEYKIGYYYELALKWVGKIFAS